MVRITGLFTPPVWGEDRHSVRVRTPLLSVHWFTDPPSKGGVSWGRLTLLLGVSRHMGTPRHKSMEGDKGLV